MLQSRKMLFVGVICLLVNIFYSHKALAATACDTAKFGQFFKSGGQTFALATQPMTWEEANQVARAAGGELAVIPDATINDEIQSKLSASFSTNPSGAKEAWIGLTDPANSATYCIDGQTTPCTPMPERFSWLSGSSTYTNWAASKPDNRCTVAERIANPNYACYGEDWATMQAGGTWDDDGNHGPTELKLKGIVQWSNILICVQDTVPISAPTGDILDPSAGLWCASQDMSTFKQCVPTEGGGTICPSDKVACNAVLDTPVCPPGTTLDSVRHMCQANPVIKCGSGYTWDQTIDKCVATAICAGNGVLSTIADVCETTVAQICPTGFTYDALSDSCKKPVDCGTGAYNSALDRCEASPAYSCSDPSYSYNSGAGRCEKAPVCSQGSYNSTFNICIQTVTPTCPDGYVLENGRCELIPQCSQGTYNPVTNKCQSGSSYPAVSSSQPALYDKPVYICADFGRIDQVQLGGCIAPSTLYAARTPYTGSKALYYYGTISSLGMFAATKSISTVQQPIYSDIYGYASTGPLPGLVPFYLYSGPFYGSGSVIYINDNYPLGGYLATAPGTYGDGGTPDSCPSGGTLVGATCSSIVETNPTCPGGNFQDNGVSGDVCWANYTPSCPSGMTYDAGAGSCTIAPTCSNGLLDGGADKCFQASSDGCASGYSLSGGICIVEPAVAVCAPGVYDPTAGACRATIARDCGDQGYLWNSATSKCELPPQCPSDPTFSLDSTRIYSPPINQCIENPEHSCITGTAYNGIPVVKCEAVPVCSFGVYNPQTGLCYNNQQTCPIGDFPCSQLSGDATMASSGAPMLYCTPNPCSNDTTSQMVSEDTPAGENDIQPDGELDADGNCTGSIYIFNGTDSRCVKEDTRTVIVAVTKLAAQIAASVFLGPMGAFLVSAATSILGDAALGNLGTGTIMAVGFAAISAGVGSYGSEMMNSVTSSLGESWNTLIGSVATDVASTGGTVINTASATVSTASTSTMSSLTTSIRDSLVEDFGLSAATADLVVDKGAGAAADMAEAGLFSSFSAMKCCYPDPLNAGCLPEEITQANNAKNGLCHIVGSYCATKWLGACVVTKETSCCYDSKIGRIIAEQGRPQLAAFAGIPNDGFGTPKSPVCRGFKPEEFQYIDMRKVDFAEFIEDITTRSSEQIKSMMENAGNKFRQGQLSTSTP